MKRDSSDRENRQDNFRLIHPAVAFLSVGMIIPEYLVAFVVSVFFAAMLLAIVQTINSRDDVAHAEAPQITP